MERAAKRNLRDFRAAHEAGRLLGGGQPTSSMVLPSGDRDMNLKELVVRHLEYIKANRSASTFEMRQRSVLYLLGQLGARPVSSISADDLQRFADWLRQKHAKRKEGGWHPIRDAKAMVKWAIDQELISFPLCRFPKGSERRATTKRFSEDDMAKLLNVAKGEFGDMVRCGAILGLRPKELRELRHDQVDWDAKPCPLLTIEHHKTYEKSKVPTPRSIPLSQEARDIIQRQRRRHPSSQIVFLNADGRPFERTVLRNRLIRLCRKAKIQPKSPYALRHFFGTKIAQATGLCTVAQLLGHSQIQTSMRYIANNEPAHVKAMEDMAKLVEDLGGKTHRQRRSL